MNKKISRLTGKAGVGLVMFHLGRLGLEFTPTSENSDAGDLWVKSAEGIVPVEVKSSWGENWPIRASQVQAVRYFCFVCMVRARCWIATSADVGIAVGSQNSALRALTISKMPPGSEDAWHLLTGGEQPILPHVIRRPRRDYRGQKKYLYARVVRKTLADGTIKEYRYGPQRETKSETGNQTG